MSICIGYSTIETKEAARIGYNRFRFPHSYSGEGLGVDITGFFFRMSTQVKAEVRSTKPSPEYECGKRNPLYPIRAASFVSIILYPILVHFSPRILTAHYSH